MSETFLGDIRIFPYTAGPAPAGWLPCDGQILLVQQYEGLFSLIGSTYGGDGQTNFALPDLRCRVPMGSASGTFNGQTGGAEAVALGPTQVPPHGHVWNVSLATDDVPAARTGVLGENPTPTYAPATDNGLCTLYSQTLSSSGFSLPHPNMQPFTVMTYYIAVTGTYPNRPN